VLCATWDDDIELAALGQHGTAAAMHTADARRRAGLEILQRQLLKIDGTPAELVESPVGHGR
jgi:ketosteroid isomerase-like protein